MQNQLHPHRSFMAWTLAFALAPLAALGCGDDDGTGAGGSHPCHQLCVEQDAQCTTVTTIEDCQDLCDFLILTAENPECEPAMREWNECQLENDPCSPENCEAEQQAFHDEC